VVIETAALNEQQMSEYCRRKGLYPEQVQRWREAAAAGTSGAEQLSGRRNQYRASNCPFHFYRLAAFNRHQSIRGLYLRAGRSELVGFTHHANQVDRSLSRQSACQ
jgi:hypothetical protein